MYNIPYPLGQWKNQDVYAFGIFLALQKKKA